ncbi:Alpha/Beta hydrolase protein [Cantharellus anzutake]|uniref:Alpha/Beta hydrolase protein n=1 Tax=Cantharellus anzutake TaxID=1750568 RepID=UPI001903CB18|nr:Alpha/Beta hydrolase protein [Cantharellus anzutake]KAF8329504.1 Alpha/Beta hydrolase protein [Cantharellus anzutake]
MAIEWNGRLAIPKLPPSPSLLQRASYHLCYLQVKILAVIFRVGVAWHTTFRRYILGRELAWERSYHKYTREYAIPSTKSSRLIKIRVWEPPEEFAAKGPRPVHINFHGGGFVLQGFGIDADFCELLSNELGTYVLDCDYAKAPENPFPHAYNDAVDVVDHVFKECADYDLSNFTMSGFSAGAALATTTSCTSPNVKGKPKALVLMYPPGDFSRPPGPPLKPRKGSTAPVLSSFVLEVFNAAIVQPPYHRSDPRISPLCDDPRDFPKKICIVTGELDNIKLGGELIAVGIKESDAGIYLEEHQIPDVGHAWDKTAIDGTWEDARRTEAYRRVIEFLRKVHKSR